MRIDSTHPDFEKAIIRLNDKIIKTAIRADDEEGWVEIPDISSMAPLKDIPLDLSEQPDDLDKWEEVPTKILSGKVEIKIVS